MGNMIIISPMSIWFIQMESTKPGGVKFWLLCNYPTSISERYRLPVDAYGDHLFFGTILRYIGWRKQMGKCLPVKAA
jgi:hypothetical protein